IISPRSSSGARTAALKRMEVLIGSACVQFTSQTPTSGNAEDLHELMRLQDGFECNLPSKLLPWISLSSPKLEYLSQSSKNGLNLDKDDDYSALKELTTQLCLSLSIVQGVALNHPRSKRWLGKIQSLEILVDLLLASRHVPSSIDSPASSSTSSKRGVTPPSLTSAILDTMLCILVDSTPALRAFEECNGVQAIVKILKRAGSPREVRMKCLEFLYFYLLDETKPSIPTTSMSTGGSLFPPTVPNTPRENTHSRQNSRSIIRGASNSSISSTTSSSSTSSVGSGSTAPRAQSKKPYLNGLAAPIRPSPKPRSEYGSSTFSFPHSSYSGPSVRSEAASEKGYITESSPSSRSNSNHLNQAALGPRSLMMLAKDVDFVPQSPQKMQTFRRDNDPASAAPRRRTRTHSRTRSAFALGATSTRISSRASSRERGHSRARSVGRADPELSQKPNQQVELRDTDTTSPGRATTGISLSQRDTTAEVSKEGLRMDIRARTTEEKKELLGTMLGNVDALVEGVRKAGIWGLG
ncbi:MAG: cell division control protein 14, SIN component-domain-containing protein, partial [Lentinula lateritia]